MTVKKIMAFALGLVCLQLSFAGTAAAESGRQTFVLSQLPGQEQIRVTAAGPIRGVGIDVVVNEVEDEETGVITAEDRFEFPEGSVSVTSRITVTSPFSVDPRTCVGRVEGTVSYQITGGTRRYAGATGDGTARSASSQYWAVIPMARARRSRRMSWRTSSSCASPASPRFQTAPPYDRRAVRCCAGGKTPAWGTQALTKAPSGRFVGPPT